MKYQTQVVSDIRMTLSPCNVFQLFCIPFSLCFSKGLPFVVRGACLELAERLTMNGMALEHRQLQVPGTDFC